jgi:hypothetical protein
MVPPLTVFVVYFAGKDPRFRPLLRLWLEYFQRSGCRLPLRILTDVATVRDHSAGPWVVADKLHDETRLLGLPCTVVDPFEFTDLMREGNAFDRKSAIICAALPFLPSCVIVDTDSFFVRDPTAALLANAVHEFAMAPDAGRRMIPLIGDMEQSSSVMVFGKAVDYVAPRGLPSLGMTKARRFYGAAYRRAWHALADHPDEQHGLLSDIREQRAWSVVRFNDEAPLLPDTLNWSRFWGDDHGRALIHHAHGREKWEWLAGRGVHV